MSKPVRSLELVVDDRNPTLELMTAAVGTEQLVTFYRYNRKGLHPLPISLYLASLQPVADLLLIERCVEFTGFLSEPKGAWSSQPGRPCAGYYNAKSTHGFLDYEGASENEQTPSATPTEFRKLIRELTAADPTDQAAFCHLMNRAFDYGLHTVPSLARQLGTSLPTVKRYLAGVAAPHRFIRPAVYQHLKQVAETLLAELLRSSIE